MTSSTNSLLSVLSASLLTLGSWHAAEASDGPVRSPVARVSIAQPNPNQVIYTVPWNGSSFGAAELHAGPASAFDFDVSASCPEAWEGQDGAVVHLDASIDTLRLRIQGDAGSATFEPGDGQTIVETSLPSGEPVIGAGKGPKGKTTWQGHLVPRPGGIGAFAPAQVAVGACTQRLAALEREGLSRNAALARLRSVEPFEVRAKAELACVATMLEDTSFGWQEESSSYSAESQSLALPMRVTCASDARFDELTQTSGVTNVALAPVEPVQRSSCPATVRFQGSITSNGPLEGVRFRTVNQSGEVGPVRTVDFPSAMSVPVSFEIELDEPRRGASARARTGPNRPTGLTASAGRSSTASGPVLGDQTAPRQQTGWVRLEVIGGPKTDEAFWKVICETPTAGPGGLTARPTNPRPRGAHMALIAAPLKNAPTEPPPIAAPPPATQDAAPSTQPPNLRRPGVRHEPDRRPRQLQR